MADAPAINFLRDHRKGELADELSEAIQEVTLAAIEHEKKGHVTLKLEIDGDGMVVFVTDTITKRVPEADRSTAIMFPDKDGNLSRVDPNQLSLSEAEAEKVVVDGDKVVDINTGEVVG